MEIHVFADITQNVIEDEGFDDFLPVACFPSRREIRALDLIPEDVDIEKAVLGWATDCLEKDTEFLVAFKISGTEFKVIRWLGGTMTSEVFRANHA